MRRNKPKDLEILISYFRDEKDWEELTDHQQGKAKQMRYCYAQLLEAWDHRSIVSKLHTEFSLPSTSAYRLIRDTEKIFGSLRKVQKEILRQIAVDAAKNALRAALDSGKAKDIIAATRLLSDVGGLNVEDPDSVDFDKLQPSLIVTVLPEGMESQIQKMLSGGLIDLNKFTLEKTIDVEYEEITKAEDSGGNRSATQ